METDKEKSSTELGDFLNMIERIFKMKESSLKGKKGILQVMKERLKDVKEVNQNDYVK